MMAHYIKDPSPQMTRMQAGHPPDAGFSEPPRLALLPELDLVAQILPNFVEHWREIKQLPPLEQVSPRQFFCVCKRTHAHPPRRF